MSTKAIQPTQIVLFTFIGFFALLTGILTSHLASGDPAHLAVMTFLLLVPFTLFCVLHPLRGFGIAILVLPLSYQFQIANLDLTLGEPFLMVAVGVLLISAIGRRAPLETLGYGLPLAALLTGLALSLSLWPTETAFGVFRKVLAGGGTFLALVLTRPDARDLHWITRCFQVSGLMVASVALLQTATGAFGFDERFVQQRGFFEAILSGQVFSAGGLAEVRMANSTFNHFNMAGAYLDLAFPFFFLQALATKRVAGWLGLGLIVLGINATHSRGSLLAVFVSTAFLLFMLYHKPLSRWLLLLLYSALTAVVALAAVALNVEETLSLYGSAGRFALWQASWEGFLSNPIVGNGLGRTADLIEEFTGVRYAAHNIYLQLLSDAGIVGSVAFLLLVTVFFKHFRLLQKTRMTSKGQSLILGWTGAMVAYLAHGMVDHALFQPAFTAFFFIALAVMGLAFKERIAHGN